MISITVFLKTIFRQEQA